MWPFRKKKKYLRIGLYHSTVTRGSGKWTVQYRIGERWTNGSLSKIEVLNISGYPFDTYDYMEYEEIKNLLPEMVASSKIQWIE